MDNVQQHPILKCGNLECHDLGICEIWPGQKALELFGHMQMKGVSPDAVTFVGVLNSCASVVALEEGRYVHQ